MGGDGTSLLMTPILVTGGTGQLATALAKLGGARVVRVGRPAFDFDRPESLDETVAAHDPTLVVNAAAWTAVDAAEQHPDAAARANVDGPARLARLCSQRGIPLIHVSTDYVFDGMKGAPYRETDQPNPIGVYGRTKLAGEQAALAAWERVAVLRTSWVYSPVGKNFVRTMLAAAARNQSLRVVADQRGCPTAAWDLAAAILTISEQMLAGWRPEHRGVFHAAGTGDTTWYCLALDLFEAAARHGRPVPDLVPITTAEWPTPVRRPPDSRLNCARLAQTFGVRLPPWRE
ncbi:MAG: dTDP-4-dehydrorhamnose reductase, partial [Acetobacteraceae bacterium]|nr:dTDP-4-dehydrorhamnose reductase [Acetobacteraceae bacterium]